MGRRRFGRTLTPPSTVLENSESLAFGFIAGLGVDTAVWTIVEDARIGCVEIAVETAGATNVPRVPVALVAGSTVSFCVPTAVMRGVVVAILVAGALPTFAIGALVGASQPGG